MHEFKYLHQTVEHCLVRPLPGNVSLRHADNEIEVYAVDLPASVWAAVTVNQHDVYDNTIERFPSASLRDDWIGAELGSLRLDAAPTARAARAD